MRRDKVEEVVSNSTVSYPCVRACRNGKRVRVTSIPEGGRVVGKGRLRKRNMKWR